MIFVDLNLVPATFKANNKVYASIKDAYLYAGHIQPDVYFGKKKSRLVTISVSHLKNGLI